MGRRFASIMYPSLDSWWVFTELLTAHQINVYIYIYIYTTGLKDWKSDYNIGSNEVRNYVII